MRKAGPWLQALLLLSSSNAAQADGYEPVAAFRPEAARAGGLVIEPERSTTIAVSNRDINRIHCSTVLNDVLWSKEKPVSVEIDGANVFVKFLVKRIGERESFTTTPVDLHVFCGGEVYTLILTPNSMDSVTLRLGNPAKSAAVAVNKEWGSLPLEDKVKKLTLAMYRDELPSSFKLSPLPENANATRLMAMRHSQLTLADEHAWINAFVRGIRRVSAPGIGLMATEYEVMPRSFPLTFSERDFLAASFGSDIVAVTVHPLTVTTEAKRARVIVIERSITGGQ